MMFVRAMVRGEKKKKGKMRKGKKIIKPGDTIEATRREKRGGRKGKREGGKGRCCFLRGNMGGEKKGSVKKKGGEGGERFVDA